MKKQHITNWKFSSTIHHFSSAVWVLLKVNEDDLEIMSGSLNQVKSNLFRKKK